MSKKRFLLVSPNSFDLYKLIVRNLEFLGYDVVHVEDGGYLFKYQSWKHRIVNLFRKTILRDKEYKNQLRTDHLLAKQREILNRSERFDFGLVLRADLFRKELIANIRDKTDYLFSFHFDGIARNPSVIEYLHYFDRFFVFNPTDVYSYPSCQLIFSPNFYFDFPDLVGAKSITVENNRVYYVSSYNESREQDLINIHRWLSSRFEAVEFIVVCLPEKMELIDEYVKKNMTILHHHVSFEEQLEQILDSEIIIDLVIAEHNGYSFRIFEGLKFGKKVITTNSKIVEADFYHPNNFFVLRDDNYDDLECFLKQPYFLIDESVKGKYSFTSWLDNKFVK